MNVTIKKAYSFAEILITLLILGAIFVFVIPTLIKDYNDKITVTKVKRIFYVLDTAFERLAIDSGGSLYNLENKYPKPNQGGTTANQNVFASSVAKYLSVRNNCGAKSTGECNFAIEKGTWTRYIYRNLDNSENRCSGAGCEYNGGKLILTNGMNITFDAPRRFRADGYSSGFVGTVTVDINGKKPPNRLGYDIFQFGFGEKGMLLNQTELTGSTGAFYRKFCNGPSASGTSCGLYIIRQGNVDYKYKNVGNKW